MLIEFGKKIKKKNEQQATEISFTFCDIYHQLANQL